MVIVFFEYLVEIGACKAKDNGVFESTRIAN